MHVKVRSVASDAPLQPTLLRSPCELRRVWVHRSAEREGGRRNPLP